MVRTRADPNEENKGKPEVYIERVVEQRVTNLAQGLLILATMSPPLLHVLGLIPQGVLAGLFFVMGVDPLSSRLTLATRNRGKWDDIEDIVATKRQVNHFQVRSTEIMSIESSLLLCSPGTHWLWRHIRDNANNRYSRDGPTNV